MRAKAVSAVHVVGQGAAEGEAKGGERCTQHRASHEGAVALKTPAAKIATKARYGLLPERALVVASRAAESRRFATGSQSQWLIFLPF